MSKNFCLYCMNEITEGKPCAVCGLTHADYKPSPHHLVPGTVLKGKYLIGRVLGEGGFGITYIACDMTLEMKVAVKEYFPIRAVSRNAEVSPQINRYVTQSDQSFESGKQKFLNEARTMARMSRQREVVGVHDFFEENGTAYIVMDYVNGITMRQLVEHRGGRIPAPELLKMVQPLFGALENMHKAGLIHRDISPENLMLEDGQIRLLDFGCARESADGIESLTITLKHGYAPMEQYMHYGQGAWTDVYALCATLYYCMTGQVPANALDRNLNDTLVPPRKLGAQLTESQEQALLSGLVVNPSKRCKSIEMLYNGLYPQEKTEPETPKATPFKGKQLAIAGAGAALLLLIAILGTMLATHSGPFAHKSTQLPVQTVAATAEPKPEMTEAPAPEPTEEAPIAEATAEPDGAIDTLDGEAHNGESWIPEANLREALASPAESLTVRGVTSLSGGDTLTITKPVTLAAGATLLVHNHVVIGEGGSITVQKDAGLHCPGIVEIARGGRLVVEQGGFLDDIGGIIVHDWDGLLLGEGVEKDNLELPRTRVPLWTDRAHRSSLIVIDEDALRADSVEVSNGNSFRRAAEDGKTIRVTGEVTLNGDVGSVGVPVIVEKEARLMIAEGSTLDVSLLVNHGVVDGRLCMNLHSMEGQDHGCGIVNYGRITDLEDVVSYHHGMVFNAGELIAEDGDKNNLTLLNTGTANLNGSLDGACLTSTGCIDVNAGDWNRVWLYNGGSLNVCAWGHLNYKMHDAYITGKIRVENHAVFENLGYLHVDTHATAQSRPAIVVDKTGTFKNSSVIMVSSIPRVQLEGVDEGDLGRIVSSYYDYDYGDLTAYVVNENDLREFLASDTVRAIFVVTDEFTIHGDLVIDNKTVSFLDTRVSIDGDVVVKGENAFLLGNAYTDLLRHKVTVTDGAVMRSLNNMSELNVYNGGLCVELGWSDETAPDKINVIGGSLIDIYMNEQTRTSIYIEDGELQTNGLFIRTLTIAKGGYAKMCQLNASESVVIQKDGELVLISGQDWLNTRSVTNNGKVYTELCEIIGGAVYLNRGEWEVGGLAVGGTFINTGTLRFNSIFSQVTGPGQLNNRSGTIYAENEHLLDTFEGWLRGSEPVYVHQENQE